LNSASGRAIAYWPAGRPLDVFYADEGPIRAHSQAFMSYSGLPNGGNAFMLSTTVYEDGGPYYWNGDISMNLANFGDLRYTFSDKNSGAVITYYSNENAYGWTHFGFTYDRSIVRIYSNGQL